MPTKKEKNLEVVDAEIIEAAEIKTEAQELAELNVYKNEIIAKHREVEKAEAINNASILEVVGMVKSHEITEKFNKTLRTIKLREIRDSKEYKNLTLTNINGEPVTVNSWADFCKAIGSSKSRVEDDIQNLNTFGQEFMQLSESIGLSYRELQRMKNQLKNPILTHEEKQAIEEAKEKDPNELLLILQDLQDKQAKMEEDVKKIKSDNVELQESIKAKDRFITGQNKKITELELVIDNKAVTAKKRQHEANILFNTLTQEFSSTISNTQSLKVAFNVLRDMANNGELNNEDLVRFEESTLSFLKSIVTILMEIRTQEFDLVDVMDSQALLWRPDLSINKNTSEDAE